MTFSLVIHHEGIFVYKPLLEYTGGKRKEHDDLDLDQWGYFEVRDMVKDLGYTVGKFKLWWRKAEDVQLKKLRPIFNDLQAMELGTFAEKRKERVEVFVEHDEEELPLRVTFRPKPINPSFKNPSPAEPSQTKVAPAKAPNTKVAAAKAPHTKSGKMGKGDSN